ncbi:hypothetical protein LJC26_02635 [Desulfovibrio sp. OttesenSCG-928-O18]|nr:hypothetical protein [Desulfovibrio sp. OttesenSCG-928-O18]
MSRSRRALFALCLSLALWPSTAVAARIRVPILDGPWWLTLLGLLILAVGLYAVQRLLRLAWEKICGMLAPKGKSKYFK